MSSSQPRIDEALSAFIQGGVSILAASSDERNHPVIVRAVGCEVSPDRRRVTLLVPGSDPFVEAIRETGRIAVTFTRPSTHETFQLKGNGAKPLRRRKTDVELTARYRRDFAADLRPLGFADEVAHSIAWCDPSDLTPVAFEPSTAFLQTPGPRAGTPLTTP